MNFRKTSEGGGGVISDPKNYVALFSVKEKRNGHRFPRKSATFISEKRVGSLHPEKFRCKKRNIVSRK